MKLSSIIRGLFNIFFLGYTFASGSSALNTTPVPNNTIKQLKISNAIFDDLFITKKYDQPYTTIIPSEWDYDTILKAYFKGNLSAGNVEFTYDTIDSIKIKRRIKGTFNWVYIYRKIIHTGEDFAFEFFDYTPRSNTDYEYALVPAAGIIEGDYIINSINTNFIGIFITENGQFFTTRMEIDRNNQQQNRQASVIQTMGRKYPFVISNGLANYKSGNLMAVFAVPNEDCSYDFKHSWKYRRALNEFLFNLRPKLLKFPEGEMYLISVSSATINEREMGHELLVQTDFEWSEIGNCDLEKDLYYNGFIDVYDGIETLIEI